MGRYQDILPSQQGWIHDLAKSEFHPDAEKLLQLNRSLDPQQLVEESTVDFLMELREQMNEYARVFNGYAESGSRFQEIKIYTVAQTPSDFMMFRNQVKLVISNSAHGLIQFIFANHMRSTVAVDGQNQSGAGSQLPPQPQDLVAQVGPFRDIHWTFQGEKVTPAQVAKFYFAEFVKLTKDARKTKSGNQALLEQIKTLLQEKGLEI